MAESNSRLSRDSTMQVTAKEEKADSMGAKIEDDTQTKKGEIEADLQRKKSKVSNSQNEAGDAKELKQRRSSYKRLGISEDEAEKLLRSEDTNEGRRTRSRSRGGATESPRAAKKATPTKETPSKRGRKAKKATPTPAATAAEEEEEEATAEKGEEAAKEEAKKKLLLKMVKRLLQKRRRRKMRKMRRKKRLPQMRMGSKRLLPSLRKGE